MFDQQVPQQSLSPLQELQQIGRGLAEQTAPMLREKFGYESPEREMRRIASETDLSNVDSVQETFNTLMAKNPQAAIAWRKSVMPIVTSNLEQQKLAAVGEKTSKDPAKQAQKVNLQDLMNKYGDVLGAQKFLEQQQQAKLDVAAASAGVVEGKVDYADIPKLSSDWRAESEVFTNALNTVGKARTLLDQADEDDNAVASELLNRELIKLVGDSQISSKEIDSIKKSGSLPSRLANALSLWVSGVPTDLKTSEIRTLLTGLERYSQKGYNDRLARKKAAYKQSTLPRNIVDGILGNPIEIKSNLTLLEQAREALAKKQGVK